VTECDVAPFGPDAVEAIPSRFSLATRRKLLEALSVDDLEHLVVLKRTGQAVHGAARGLSPEKIEELAEMIIAERTPTIGWWRRARAASAQPAVPGGTS
jgi:hypothetical protein